MKHLFVFLTLLFVPTLSLAANPAPQAEAEISSRMDELEKRQAEIYHTLAEKKAAGLATQITERITISGLIEVEGAAEDAELTDGTSDAASDLTLATAQLGFGVEVTDHILGDLIFLFEEGDEDSDIEVDEAAINLVNEVWFGRIGRQYLPFGAFHSHFISDPLTLELGETRETALLGGYKQDRFSLSAFVFNGDAEKAGQEDHLRDWGVSLTLTPGGGFEMGASYLSDLADTDAELVLSETNPDNEYGDRVGGWSAYATAAVGKFELSAEALGAVEAFEAIDLDADGNGAGDKPLAWNLELAYYHKETLEFSARLEGSDELAGQPELQYGAGVSWAAWENVSLSLEYLRGEFDEAFGEGLDNRNLVTAQLALEF